MWTQKHLDAVRTRARLKGMPYYLLDEYVSFVLEKAVRTYDPERSSLMTFLMRLTDWARGDFYIHRKRKYSTELYSLEYMEEVFDNNGRLELSESPDPYHAIELKNLIKTGKFNDIILNEMGYTTTEIAAHEKRSGQAIRGRLFKQRNKLRELGLMN